MSEFIKILIQSNTLNFLIVAGLIVFLLSKLDIRKKLQNTADAIVKNISPDLGNNKIFTILSRAYQDFKRFIINIKKRYGK